MNLKSTLGAALLLLAAVPAASAGSGGDTECGYERTSTGGRAYVCRSIYRSPYSTTYQTCAANRISSACQTRTVDKTPIVQDPRSSRIMDGHGPP